MPAVRRAPGRFGPRALLPPASLLASASGLLWLRRLDERPVLLLALLAVGFASLLMAVRRPSWPVMTPAAILAVGACLRLILLPLPPTLSDDVYRYLWDGRVLVAGSNPYALPPDSARLEPLRDDLFEQMSHRDVETVYPPLAMVPFSIAALFPAPLVAYKAMVVLADLLACGLLLQLARRSGVPLASTVWYVWNPLVALEGAGMGHVDVFGVLCVTAAVLLLTRGANRGGARARLAAGAAAAGVLVKLVPIVALPLWARASARPWRWIVVALLLVGLGLLPVVWSVDGLPPGLVVYGVEWEFNGLVFEPLWRLLDAASVDELVKDALDALKGLTGWHATWNRVYPYVYPQLLAKTILAAALVAVVVAGASLRGGVLVGTQRVLGGALLCSATLYPWYLLWVLPFAALTGSVPWLVLSASICLAYLPEAGVARFPQTYLCVWLPFVVAHLVAWRRRATA